MWKIYKHTLIEECDSKGKSYIGLTCERYPSGRWDRGRGYSRRQKLFYNAIQKHGGPEMWDINWSHEIIEDNIQTLEEASEREKYWIAYYHTWVRDPECWGYNITPGGQGRSHPQTAETKRKISNSLKGRSHAAWQYKINKTLKRKSIICIETAVIYESISEAARQTGIGRENLKTAVNGKRLSAGGYHWAAVDDLQAQSELKQLNGKCKKAKAPVKCIETNKIYESITAAARTVGCDQSAISSCLSGRLQTVCGYHWEYIKK